MIPESMKHLGQYMRKVRMRAGLSLPEAAEKTGIPNVVIGSYERGQRNPNFANLKRWVEPFDHQLALLPPGAVVASAARVDDTAVRWYVVIDGESHPAPSREYADRWAARVPGAQVAHRLIGPLTIGDPS